MSLTETMVGRHIITALVQNEAGTINRLVSLFRRRGFSIECFNAGDCEQTGFSRLTLVVNANDAELSQCLKQLDKLIDVVEVQDLKPSECVQRELALIRVESADRAKVEGIATEFAARVIESDSAQVVEIAADVVDINRLIDALHPFNVTEIVRTGTVAIPV